MKIKTRNILAENEGEFSTEIIYQSRGKFYRIEENGGARGSYDRRCGDGVWRDRPVSGPDEISRDEALSRCAAMGVEEVEIDE